MIDKRCTLDKVIVEILQNDHKIKKADLQIIPWSCPIPAFGDIENALIATVGLNPSKREFVDQCGTELKGLERRFPTLTSVERPMWSPTDSKSVGTISDACRRYFERTPYNAWFSQLEGIICRTGMSYYPPTKGAAHIDLVPYATWTKWGALDMGAKRALCELGAEPFIRLIQDTSLRLLVLNGKEVVRCFERALDIALDRLPVPEWSLGRRRGADIRGVAYQREIEEVCGLALGRRVTILGFNHNVQSSFGVTRHVRSEIAEWLRNRFDDAFYEGQ